MRRSLLALALVFAVSVTACGSAAQSPSASGSTSTPSGSVGGQNSPAQSTDSAVAATTSTPAPNPTDTPAPDTTVWLCKPGIANDPCAGSLDATIVDAAGKATPQPASPAADPPIDCFYVYPTVSRQKTVNATLTIDPEERAVAVAQASRFSPVCRVYAPMYPQLTLAAIADPSKISGLAALAAYNSVDSAFRSYMANYNHGRGFVVIGHSQGAILMTAVLKYEVDTRPEWRKQLVSALLLGGNVTVGAGKTVGGAFANIPACSSSGADGSAGTATGCVVAYSSFASAPPANAVFGRTDSPLNLLAGGASGPQQVLCVNPTAPGGGAGALLPYYPTTGLQLLIGRSVPKIDVATPWVSFPNQYTAHCITANGATWLQVDPVAARGDPRMSVLGFASPTWGLHLVDVNIALGNLVALVGSQSAAYR